MSVAVLVDDARVTPAPDLDRKLGRLRAEARAFARAPVRQKATWVREVAEGIYAVAEAMVQAACQAKGIDASGAVAGEEWIAGPAVTLRNARLLAEALEDVARHGRPRVPDTAVSKRPDGQLAVEITPRDAYDRALFGGFTCEARFLRGVEGADLASHQARFYGQGEPEGGVALVLGAGNVASIPPMDVLYKMFVEGKVCLLKMNPVNAYLGPLLERAFAGLIERGFFDVVYGGGEVGEYLCAHDLVDEIHITGSDKTHDLIVWGSPGPARDERKRRGEPLNRKKITSELGNVSPVLIVPGPYDDDDLETMAHNVAGMVTYNASFNCNAAKLLILPRGWQQRDSFLARLGAVLERVPPRRAYYPGAHDRYASLVAGQSQVRRFGVAQHDQLPWTLVLGLDAERPDLPQFTVEPFCALMSEVEVGSEDPVDFLRQATKLANDRVWGTLNATLFVHPRHETDSVVGPAFERALTELRYGAVAVNHFPGMVYGLAAPPWGAHPSSTLADIQSGTGWVHNTLMFEEVEKVVLRGPLRAFPKPAWFPDHRTLNQLGQKLVEFERAPSWLKIPSLALSAARA
jgi:acyl-CoA reductase-like NAD-dependent aldehyde dehydrogenase